MRRIPLRAQKYEPWTRGRYTVCGSLPASICILVDMGPDSGPYDFWIPMVLSYYQERTGMEAIAIGMRSSEGLLPGDYTWMYEAVFGESSCEYIVILTFGNGLFFTAPQPSYYDMFAERMRSLARFGRVGLVYGGIEPLRLSPGLLEWVQLCPPCPYEMHHRRVRDACDGIISFIKTEIDMLSPRGCAIQIAECIQRHRFWYWYRQTSLPIRVHAFFLWLDNGGISSMRNLMTLRSRL